MGTVYCLPLWSFPLLELSKCNGLRVSYIRVGSNTRLAFDHYKDPMLIQPLTSPPPLPLH